MTRRTPRRPRAADPAGAAARAARTAVARQVSSAVPAWALACFFFSGVAGLLDEVVWSKQLSILLGSSLHATAAVVAAFLGGLALGAHFLGVPLARRRAGVRAYALLEVGVAIAGIVILPVLRGLEMPLGALYRGLGGEGVAFAAARLAVLIAVL